MRIFVLYCLFFFPLSYVIAKNGYVEQHSAKYHSLTEKDTLYIETEFDCFAVYDNVADGNRFLFFDYESQIAYITPTCFSGFYPIYSSVDFSKLEVLLRNEHSHLKQLNDTLSVDSNVAYVPFNCNNRIIKATFVQYPQAGKGNKYLTTKDSI